MVQMVFVHGVSTRKEPDPSKYDQAVEARDRRFKEVTFGGSAEIANPYWGQFGARPITCIPDFSARYESLALEMKQSPDLILKAAREDFPALIAALSVASLQEAAGNARLLQEEERLWAGAARYADIQPNPPWLGQVQTDDEFFARLKENAEASAPGKVDLGLVNGLKTTASKLAGGFSNLVNSPFGKIGREVLSPRIAIFVGDVFRYLKDGDGRPKIRQEVSAHLEAAARKAKAEGDKLILVGHSMGGVILYDLLSDDDAMAELDQRLGFKFECDLLLTVGSQVAVFEEMKVFSASRAGKADRPARVHRWWNVFDKMDVLSFLAEPAFNGVEDLQIDTIAGVKDAHGAYFESMLFYARLNRRLTDAKLI